MTRAGRLSLGQGVSAAAIRPTETRCRISSHVVASNQFRGPGLRCVIRGISVQSGAMRTFAP